MLIAFICVGRALNSSARMAGHLAPIVGLEHTYRWSDGEEIVTEMKSRLAVHLPVLGAVRGMRYPQGFRQSDAAILSA